MNPIHPAIRIFRLQVEAASFGIFLVSLCLISSSWKGAWGMSRMDWLFVAAALYQIRLLRLGAESRADALLILVFHALAMAMEIFKVRHGCWIYPEYGKLAIAGVPLFTGFMYSAVGSWLCRSWRLHAISFEALPHRLILLAIGLLAYGNFFLQHFGRDCRWLILGLALVVFHPIRLSCRWKSSCPLTPLLVAAAILIWLAENLCTLAGVWFYPSQLGAWQTVSLSKIPSWFLLLLLTFALSVLNHKPKTRSPQ